MANEKNVPATAGENSRPFPNRLRNLIEESKTSQADLAKHIGVTRQAISSYSLGTTIPDIEKFEKIADYFEVSLDYLLGRSQCKNVENHNIHEDTGLNEKAIKNLKYCADLGDNSITRTVNDLLEDTHTLSAIAHYLYYEMDESSITTDKSSLVPFRAKYRYYKEKAQWSNSETPVPVDFATEIDCLTNEKYQKIKMLEVEENLLKLLDKVKLMDGKRSGND